MNEIAKIKITDIGLTVTGKTPSSNNPEDFGSEYMFVTPSDSFDGKMMNNTERYLSEEGVSKLSNKLLPPKSIMITCIGSAMGKASMNKTSCITNQQINSIIPSKNYFQDYVYYSIKNNYKLLRNASTGSTALPLLNKTDFDLLELPIHTKKETQQKIANVLSALDSKIELNNRINVELEAMAKTLYDYWFVQFDFPYDLKKGKPDANGKPYKSCGGKMVWNEELKREVPEVWEIAELKDIANITMGQSPPGESYNDNGAGFIFYQGSTDFGSRFPIVRQFTTKPTRFAKEGDILLSVRAPVGTMNIAIDDCCIGRGLAALRSKDNCMPFLYEVLKNLGQVFDRRNTDGTTFGAITKDDLFSLKVVKPHASVLNIFGAILNPVFEKQNVIALENKKLIELRDWLLPMLMNGQVKVN